MALETIIRPLYNFFHTKIVAPKTVTGAIKHFGTHKNDEYMDNIIDEMQEDIDSRALNADLMKRFPNTITQYSNLDDIPVNSIGSCALSANISPISDVLGNVPYVCFGSSDNRSIIVARVSTNTCYINNRFNGYWKGWVTL